RIFFSATQKGCLTRHKFLIRPYIKNLHKKLTEIGAYLQILIEKLKLNDNKLQNCTDEEQRNKTKTFKEITNTMRTVWTECRSQYSIFTFLLLFFLLFFF
uniref:Uncharacterized protein n=1 Tax=Sarcophilus harrisii TaxID=9305 RepID=A0A7N4NXK4_SARHA